MIATTIRPSQNRSRRSVPGPGNRGNPGRLVLVALLWGAVTAAFGTDREDAWNTGLSGTFLVCKECLTVRGTFLTDVHGKDVTRLNYLCGEEVDPRFCPADDRILFTSTCGGRPGLWSMNRDGRQPTRICDGDQGDWFPDGRRIALRRQGQIIDGARLRAGRKPFGARGWKSCRWPACAADGRRVLFVASDGGKEWILLATPGEIGPKRLAAGDLLGARGARGEIALFTRTARTCG